MLHGVGHQLGDDQRPVLGQCVQPPDGTGGTQQAPRGGYALGLPRQGLAPLRAVPLLQDVLGRYDATHAREVAPYRSWPAVALAYANQPEQAAEEARRVIDTSGDPSSERTAERARTVLHRLNEYKDMPEAREVLADYGHSLLA
ncbi:hypothetical protein ACFQ8O_35550 [Streptomyces coelicoflavus]|uniref:hypothetical protein n=1 Tax=Streptomyces coelicoflavus TaxID=285562 RepID=UPI0036AE452E